MATLHKKIVLDKYPYSGSNGQLRNPDGYWHTCRVTFHDRFDDEGKHNHFFFAPTYGQSMEAVVAAVDELEGKIGIPSEQRLNFHPITQPGSFKVVLTDWWRDPVRLTFLTCFMRDCGNPKGKYLQCTKHALDMFRAGNVFYHGVLYRGWQYEFTHDDRAKELLRDKPSKVKTVNVCHFSGWKTRTLKLSKI